MAKVEFFFGLNTPVLQITEQGIVYLMINQLEFHAQRGHETVRIVGRGDRLQRLGRIEPVVLTVVTELVGEVAEKYLAAVQNAAEAGFTNLSIDLIYDIAFRTKEMWESDLRTALSLPLCHLSAYSLTVEENTILARQVAGGKPFVPDECDTERDYNLLLELTEAAGFEQYEISNYAKNGMVSRHNYAYWIRTPYLGLGASAHSYCGNIRRWNVANLRPYIDGMLRGEPVRESETLDTDTQYNEMVLLCLRTNAGLNLDELAALFGKEYKKRFLKQLETVKKDYFVLKDNQIRLTRAGRLFADAMAMELFV